MKNVIICTNCKKENPFYGLICTNCKSFLRERVVNLDLFNILASLIDNPLHSFRLIIHSEHKNFIFLILFLASVKVFINTILLSVALKSEHFFTALLVKFLLILLLFSLLISIFSLLLKYFNRILNLQTRFKDNFSIIIYSLVPYCYGIIILFPIELILFGGYLFSREPSPFFLKEGLAYTLLGFEFLIILWSVFLTISAMYVQSRSKIYSVITGIIFHLILFLLIYFSSIYFY